MELVGAIQHKSVNGSHALVVLQGLGEIAFCAVAANQQVRGFGTRLMNHTKAMARDRDGLTHFLTYADNNAVGYFTKQVHCVRQSTACCKLATASAYRRICTRVTIVCL